MNDLDHKLKKDLLKPLVRRGRGHFDKKALQTALSKLEERALGEHLLAQVRSYFDSKKFMNQRLWQDADEVRQAVAAAKALYAARRISTQEYTFYALLPVEQYHDAHIYHELMSISTRLEEIRKQHGLKEDEDWQVGQGPKEYIKLNKQWERVETTKFMDRLLEFGLDDLAQLKAINSNEFDQLRERGRRSMHHRDDQVAVITDIVTVYEQDARRAASVAAYSAAVTALGAAIEGLLILRCLQSLAKASRIAGKLPRRIRPGVPHLKEPIGWHFETLIEVCYKGGWLPKFKTQSISFDSAGLAHLIRLLRNHVHPGRHFRERPWSAIDERDFKDAEAIYTILFKTLKKTLGKKQRQHSKLLDQMANGQ